ALSEQYRIIARNALGDNYSAVRVRDAIDELYQTRQIAAVSVEADSTSPNTVNIRFLVRRKTQAQRVSVTVAGEDDAITEQELLLRLNLMEAGTAITEQTLRNNADVILEYLRSRGYYKAEITYTQTPMQFANDVVVNFRVVPNTRATIESLNINIERYDNAKLADEMNLKRGDVFTRAALDADVQKIRTVLRNDDFLAPTINEPRVVYDSERNQIAIDVTGDRGPKVEVTVEAERDRVGKGTQNRLLPVRSEGTLDYAAIIEGERRLENYYQEQGYFFVDVTPACSVEPPFEPTNGTPAANPEFLCSALTTGDLTNRTVKLIYRADLNRRLKLVDIRLRGTDQFDISEIKTALETQEANILGIIPLFGYGRGYTSERLLQEDAGTIRSLLRELGYRDAEVRVNQGVSPDGENLIITFVVEEGPRTIISGVEITGNNDFTDDTLMARLPPLAGTYFSRAKIRNGQRKLAELYSEAGYYDTIVDFSVDEVPAPDASGQRQFNIVYQIKHRPDPFSVAAASQGDAGREVPGEGTKFYINRILVTGNDRTRSDAIVRALALRPGELLRAGDVYRSEQNLYESDVFSRVTIKPRFAGDRQDGDRNADIIVDVEEQAPRILTYGGGFSTDVGLSGFADIRHFNLFGRLWQGDARVRLSQRQQLAQIGFLNPRFVSDGEKRYAPLRVQLQYQRDSTVTRFFRSAFDRGTFGVVQRLDENGNPVDEFGVETGSPTLHRLTFTAETQRTISREKRSVLFVRYRFEDVRLYNIQSLLIRELLVPDSRTRISGFGATFVRDTRENCSIKFTILDIIARGEAPEPCRYDAGDPTNGSYITAEYNVSLPVLGANIGFNKFQASYQVYYTPPFLQASRFEAIRNTTFAGRAILGLANVFSRGNRFSSANFAGLDGILPISERFFAGGANTLRGFNFEEAGPRVVIVPQGTFRRSDGEPIFLVPFTVPFGGNALAVVNLEARVPVTKQIRAVPFYDGGNVFRRVGDIFNPPDVPAGDLLQQNLRALWSHTVGLGLRIKTPVGGELGVDYGYLLNPPQFQIPQSTGPNAIYRLPQSQIHFRFSQAF
ncbi:MAG: BamA/TamA family outer membrane protein, partial [Acidobacteria bacterium]|nr:BamA/TamA family outer membrane protein [Acidobacteriota bacterium]